MQSNTPFIIPFISLVSAFIGAAAALFGHKWRYRADYRNHIVVQLINIINQAADLSTDYWLLPSSNRKILSSNEQAKMEAKIEGLIEKLDGNLEIVRIHLNKIDMLGIDIPASRLVNALTGGQFGVPGRPANPNCARDVQTAAAVLILDISKAANRRVLGLI